MRSFYSFFPYIISGSPAALGVIRWRLASKGMKLFILLFFLAFLTDSSCLLCIRHHRPNLWLMHLYTLVEYCLIVMAFSMWEETMRKRNLLWGSIPAFCIVWFLAKLSIEDFHLFDAFTSTLGSLIFVLLAVRMLLRLSGEERLLHKDERFWVSVAILIYCSGGILSYAAANQMADNPSLFLTATHLRWFSISVAYLCYGAALLCRTSCDDP